MHPKRSEVLSAAVLVLFLVSLIVVIVIGSIPPEGIQTLQ
jgi:hypothetical protein